MEWGSNKELIDFYFGPRFRTVGSSLQGFRVLLCFGFP